MGEESKGGLYPAPGQHCGYNEAPGGETHPSEQVHRVSGSCEKWPDQAFLDQPVGQVSPTPQHVAGRGRNPPKNLSLSIPARPGEGCLEDTARSSKLKKVLVLT